MYNKHIIWIEFCKNQKWDELCPCYSLHQFPWDVPLTDFSCFSLEVKNTKQFLVSRRMSKKQESHWLAEKGKGTQNGSLANTSVLLVYICRIFVTFPCVISYDGNNMHALTHILGLDCLPTSKHSSCTCSIFAKQNFCKIWQYLFKISFLLGTMSIFALNMNKKACLMVFLPQFIQF